MSSHEVSAPELRSLPNGDLVASYGNATLRISYDTHGWYLNEQEQHVSCALPTPVWRATFSVSGTDVHFTFDEVAEDWTVKGSKYDRRKPAERAMAHARKAWREYLAQSFVWNAYRHTYPPDLTADKMWPDPEDFALDWSPRVRVADRNF